MVNKIILNDTPIHVDNFKEDKNGGLNRICVNFKVTSKDYHAITTLLYKRQFNVKVSERGLTFRGEIQEYSTSITNLYEKGKVGDFKLCLREVRMEQFSEIE